MPDDNVAPMLDDLPDDDAGEGTREADLLARDPGAHEEKVQDSAELHDDADDPDSAAPQED